MDGEHLPNPNAQCHHTHQEDDTSMNDPDITPTLETTREAASVDDQPKEKLLISDPRRADHLGEYKWKKGESGNPLGRPKGEVNLSMRLRKQLLEELPNCKTDQVKADLVILALVEEARNGNIQAISMILDRLEGKVTDKVDVTGAAVIFNVIEAKRPEIVDNDDN